MRKEIPTSQNKELDFIASIVMEHYGLTHEEFTRNTKIRHIVYARHMFHYICHKVKGMTTFKSGTFTNKDHSTVLNSSRKIENWLSYDKIVKNDLSVILGIMEKGNAYHEARKLLDRVPVSELPKINEIIKKHIAE